MEFIPSAFQFAKLLTLTSTSTCLTNCRTRHLHAFSWSSFRPVWSIRMTEARWLWKRVTKLSCVRVGPCISHTLFLLFWMWLCFDSGVPQTTEEDKTGNLFRQKMPPVSSFDKRCHLYRHLTENARRRFKFEWLHLTDGLNFVSLLIHQQVRWILEFPEAKLNWFLLLPLISNLPNHSLSWHRIWCSLPLLTENLILSSSLSLDMESDLIFLFCHEI
jgi:hypothetical protein